MQLFDFVHHTDAEREFAYDRQHVLSGQLDKALDEAETNGWIVADMKNDWSAVFPDAVRSAQVSRCNVSVDLSAVSSRPVSRSQSGKRTDQ
jgi:hypothetical protein